MPPRPRPRCRPRRPRPRVPRHCARALYSSSAFEAHGFRQQVDPVRHPMIGRPRASATALPVAGMEDGPQRIGPSTPSPPASHDAPRPTRPARRRGRAHMPRGRAADAPPPSHRGSSPIPERPSFTGTRPSKPRCACSSTRASNRPRQKRAQPILPGLPQFRDVLASRNCRRRRRHDVVHVHVQDGHQVTSWLPPAALNFSTVRPAMPSAMRALASCGLGRSNRRGPPAVRRPHRPPPE